MEEQKITHIDIYHRLGKLESKVDHILDKLSDGARKMDDLDKRVSSLEKLKAWGLGAAAAIGFVAAMVKDWMM
ncbi:MAG: hypothetical protein O3A90_14350 [Proteobacteria bacterium]|nr:hypothetical protein [Pseudomonadota bacterium]